MEFGEDCRSENGQVPENSYWNSSLGGDRGQGDHRVNFLCLKEIILLAGYFAINGIAEGEKIYAALVCLEGLALNGF